MLRSKGMRSVIAAGVAVVLTGSVGARAQESWSGFYFGGGGGIGSLDIDGTLTTTTKTDSFETCRIVDNGQPDPRNAGNCPGPSFGGVDTVGTISDPFNVMSATHSVVESLSENGVDWSGTAFLGYDQQLGQGLIGAFADITWLGADSDFSFAGGGPTLSLDIDYLVTVGGRVGLSSLNGLGLAYIYGGYTYAEADSPLISNADGFSVGLGGEGKLGGGWFARVDGRYTRLSSESFDLGSQTGAPQISTVGANSGVYVTCNGAANRDCVHERTSTTKTSARGEIEADVFALQVQLGYRF